MDTQQVNSKLPEVIIFFNPMGVDKSFWINKIPQFLYNKYEIILFDYPGFKSEFISHNTILETANYIYNQYIVNLNKPVHLCGYSYGGIIVQELLKKEIKYLKSIILVATQNKITNYDKELNKILMDLIDIDIMLFCRMLVLLSYDPLYISNNTLFYFQLFSNLKLSISSSRIIYQQLSQMTKIDKINFPILRNPALYIYGEFDRMVKNNTANEISKLLPNIEVIEIAGASHMIEEQLLFDEITSFLNRI